MPLGLRSSLLFASCSNPIALVKTVFLFPTPLLAAPEEIRLGILRSSSQSSLCTSVSDPGVYRGSLIREVLREIRSLFWRIAEIRRTQIHRRRASINPFPETSLRPKEYRHALASCIADIQNLSTRRPVTLLDVSLVAQGWAAGADWSRRNLCNSSNESRA
jgi:hypothetical protein